MTNINCKTSSLPVLSWNELDDDDLIRVSHKLTYDGDIWESRSITFKDLCKAVKTALTLDGAIPMQGED